MTVNGSPTVLLVHGSWHDGGSWSSVQEELAAAGVASLAPTLAGHGRNGGRDVRHDEYVGSVLEVLDAQPAPVTLVGHSFGGSVISRVAELRPERCCSLVYYSAFVPRDGESVADSLPQAFVDFLGQAAATSSDDSCALPFELFHGSLANTADEPTARKIHSSLVPEPRRPIFEPLELPTFESLDVPCAYIACRDDQALPRGSFHPGQSSRLADPLLIEIEGDHEALFTAPARLAEAIVEAVGASE